MPGLLTTVWVVWAYALGQVATGGPGQVDLVSGALAAAALAIAVTLRYAGRLPAGPSGHQGPSLAAVLRQHAARTRLPRLRDPDSAGNPRPRAPSAYPPAA